MSLSPGVRLGPYEVTALIGKGGMGEVYRATDTKLKRQVALKVLPSSVADDTERLARFQREAEVLASLNHPNIAAIHGLEESNGVKALVMELVEGPTLADRIAHGPIPTDEALPIARQIAEALEAAHEQGIIHRDLKPANVKVRPDGTVKVLDFGLAKALEPTGAMSPHGSQSPTVTSPAMMTGVGVLLGTAAYMSPEQAKGLSVDKRTDIFSFGNVLYEMLTGRQAFAGDTVAEVLARVIEREPDWSRLPKNTPEEIRHLLRRSLQKDRNRRLQTATDVRVEIEEGRMTPARRNEAGAPAASRNRERLVWMVAILVIAAAAAIATRYFRAPAEAPESRVDIVTPASSDPTSFALSPDGRRIVFVASGDGQPRLWLRQLDAAAAQPLPGTEGASFPFWSPDSRSVAFFAGAGTLMRLDIGGATAQMLVNTVTPTGGTWSTDGTILFSAFPELFRVPASGGEVEAVPFDNQLRAAFPQFLPDGRQFLFYVVGEPGAQGVYVGSLDSPNPRRLTAADSAGFYLAPGWLLYLRQGTLVARRFDPARGEITGEPVTIADQVGMRTLGGGAGAALGAFSVSTTGLVAYRAGTGVRRQLTWFDRSGKIVGTVGAPDENDLLDPTLSPDGRLVAVDRLVQGNRDIWIMDGVHVTRLTFDSSAETFPIWSPDGSRIAFRSNRKGVNDIYEKPSNGAGSEELVWESPLDKTALDFSPDGRFLFVLVTGAKTGQDLWVLPLEGERKPGVFLSTNVSETGAHISPDGRWVSYQSNVSGRIEIYVRPFPEGAGQWQISTDGGINARWRRDGTELYYLAPDGQLMAVPVATEGATFRPGTPVALFQSRSTLGGNTNARAQYTVAPDGRFLINVTVGDVATTPITLLQNWKPPAN